MTDFEQLLELAERDLRATGSVSAATCQTYSLTGASVPLAAEAAFGFLGCRRPPAHGSEPMSPERRLRIVRLMLLREPILRTLAGTRFAEDVAR